MTTIPKIPNSKKGGVHPSELYTVIRDMEFLAYRAAVDGFSSSDLKVAARKLKRIKVKRMKGSVQYTTVKNLVSDRILNFPTQLK